MSALPTIRKVLENKGQSLGKRTVLLYLLLRLELEHVGEFSDQRNWLLFAARRVHDS